jgi:hypothetical protein
MVNNLRVAEPEAEHREKVNDAVIRGRKIRNRAADVLAA